VSTTIPDATTAVALLRAFTAATSQASLLSSRASTHTCSSPICAPSSTGSASPRTARRRSGMTASPSGSGTPSTPAS